MSGAVCIIPNCRKFTAASEPFCAAHRTNDELLRQARWYVADSLEAHEHSDGRELLDAIDAALAQPAPESDFAYPDSGLARMPFRQGDRNGQ